VTCPSLVFHMERNSACSVLSVTYSLTFTEGSAMLSAKAHSSGRQNNSTWHVRHKEKSRSKRPHTKIVLTAKGD